jgi:pentatricopeptide repeat protein
VVKACGNVGAVVQAQLIHNLVLESEFYSDGYLGNALIDMYAAFGRLKDALKVFSALPERDRISWEALMAGFSLQGNFDLARKCFEIMRQKGFAPQDTTYSNILSACSHGGEVKEGNLYFKHGGNEEGESSSTGTKSEHFNCMIDLFSRAGCLETAEETLLSMPSNPDIIGWMTLLSACKTHGRVDLGKRCFQHVARHESYQAAAGYALMSSLYSDARFPECVGEVCDLTKSLSSYNVNDHIQNLVDKSNMMVMRYEGDVPYVASVSKPMEGSIVLKQSPSILISSQSHTSKQAFEVEKLGKDYSSACTNNNLLDSNGRSSGSTNLTSFYLFELHVIIHWRLTSSTFFLVTRLQRPVF